MNRHDRLRRLEGDGGKNKEDVELARQEIRRRAEHANRCQPKDAEPHFVILSGGEVFSARDGRPIVTPHQVFTEQLYWMEVASGGRGLIHDEASQTFFTPEGEASLTRDWVHLARLIGPGRRWESDDW
jgi:hypothetical protein